MKNYLCLFLTLHFTFLTLQGEAQISVSYPLENCVFQRDLNNRSHIYVAGNFTEFLDVVEVKLNPIQSGWGQQSDWIGIVHEPKNGYYSGNIEWVGGWYSLEVRGRRGGQVIGSASISRVGIGEVFLIAGQSNGQGFFGNGATSANDQRVIHVDYDGTFGPNAPLPYPTFSHLQSDDVISPRGHSAWYWAALGDALTSRLNVPVLFYNVAWEGSGVKSWQQSIGGTGYSAYDPSLPFQPSGMPYANLRNVMRNYVSMTGVRAIFWVQGEADNDVGTSQNDYYSALESLINQTRNEFSRNISWVVSRTSYTVIAGSSSRIIQAQNQIIQNIPNVFAGPELDRVQIPRPDGYHFYGDGLIAAAVAWNGSLGNDFFSRSVPHKSKPPLTINPTCNNNAVTLVSEGGLHGHRWSNGAGGSEITPGEGDYQLAAYDQEGNFRFSPRFRIPGNVGNVTRPTVSSAGTPEVCLGGTLTLRSSSNQNPVWSTGQNGSEIQISSPGDYTVSIQNPLGCRSTSDVFRVAKSNKPLPPAPTITARGETEFCDGAEVVLSATTGANTFWSNGVNNQSLATVRQTGEYTARTRDSEGCYSENSNKITVQVNPLPAKPRVNASSATVFCSGGEVTLSSSYETGNTWSNNASDRSIVVRQSGDFLVSVVDSKGCKNTSDPVKVTVNPLPAAPVISSTRPLSFCDGDYTTLASNSQHIVVWSNGANNRDINVDRSGEFWAEAVDQNGCRSPISNKLTVKANPLPERPTIRALGSTTFCENQGVELEGPDAPAYIWSTEQTQKRVTIQSAGQTYLQTVSEFGCRSPRSEPVNTFTLPIPQPPVISANGPTEICEEDAVTLTASGQSPFIWNTQATTTTVVASENGDYTARSIGSNGCYSNPSNNIHVTLRKTPEQPLLQKNGAFAIRVTNHQSDAQYNWTWENQAIELARSPIHRIDQSGIYRAQAFVTYSDILTCSSKFSEPSFFASDPGAGVMNIFPNPVRGTKVWVEAADILTNVTIVIYSMHGKALAAYTFEQLAIPVELDIPPGGSGTLIIKISADHFSASEKLIFAN
jgi:hypothetical protein